MIFWKRRNSAPLFYNKKIILSQTFIVRCKITMKINISQCNAEQYNNYYVHFFSQETLANAIQKIMGVLGSFTSEAEVKVNQLQISINTSHLFCTLILFRWCTCELNSFEVSGLLKEADCMPKSRSSLLSWPETQFYC